MPRSAADATRFTATGPYASSKPSSTVSVSAGPEGETPQQKVARLRAAARNAKLAQESQFDRIVTRGRVWADRAHRITALSLIAATGIAGVVTFFALGDMVLYNRKKRNEWLKDQHAQRHERLEKAYQAAAFGSADEDQMLLINSERAAQEAAQALSAREGFLKRARRFLFSGLSNEDAVANNSEQIRETGPGAVGEEVWKEGGSEHSAETGDRLGILQAVEAKRRDDGRQQEGGPLDRLAENIAESATEKSASLTSWTRGR